MAEKFLLEMAETIKASIPGNNIQIEDQENKAVISGDMECGIKGINVSIECSTSTIKIKGAREYKYPITEASKDIFQQEMIKKYNGDYNIYASGQMLAFSKFFSYQTSNEAINITKNAIAAMQDMVEEFENKCVNFMEKTEDDSSENEEYNPEANVNIVNVDNNYHAVSMTEQDNQAYDDEHKSFSEEIFDKLVTSIGGRRVGNEVTVSDEESGKITRCVLFPLDAEILVSVSTNVSHDELTQGFYLPKSSFRSDESYQDYCKQMYNFGYMDKNGNWTPSAKNFINNQTNLAAFSCKNI